MVAMAQFGKIRIIGGMWRGRKISPLTHSTCRPSTDRVRESLFNCLGQQLTGLTCLDAFAGSGILGLEAVSRGAAHVAFVEKNKQGADNIRASANVLDAPTTVFYGDLQRFLKQNQTRFDLIFLDPPFADYPDNTAWSALLTAICPHLCAGGRVYCESNKPITPPSSTWDALTSKRTGQVHWHIFALKP